LHFDEEIILADKRLSISGPELWNRDIERVTAN